LPREQPACRRSQGSGAGRPRSGGRGAPRPAGAAAAAVAAVRAAPPAAAREKLAAPARRLGFQRRREARLPGPVRARPGGAAPASSEEKLHRESNG
jgi:hypothetical protein